MTDDKEKPPYYVGEYQNKPAAFKRDKPKNPLMINLDQAKVESFVRYMNNYSAKLDKQGRKTANVRRHFV